MDNLKNFNNYNKMYLHVIIIVLLLIILGLLVYLVFFKKTECKPSFIQPVQSQILREISSGELNLYGLDGNPKKWIFMLKLGNGGNNCPKDNSGTAYSCYFLYADNENPKLQFIRDFTIDSEQPKNPAYQFYQLTQNHSYITWNDQGFKTCDGSQGYAHDKGGLVYTTTQAIYMQSSCPNWGIFSKGFLATSKNTPGIQTELAQHLLFVKMENSNEISNMVELMNRANICLLEGSIAGFQDCVKSDCPDEYLSFQFMNGFSILAKPKGNRGDDVWAYLNQNNCENLGMQVLSFCNPSCPLGRGESTASINNIIDINNLQRDSILNTSCSLDFDPFKSNHSKIGICNNNNIVMIGGNNHSTESQGPRGGLFVLINSAELSSSLRCLFK